MGVNQLFFRLDLTNLCTLRVLCACGFTCHVNRNVESGSNSVPREKLGWPSHKYCTQTCVVVIEAVQTISRPQESFIHREIYSSVRPGRAGIRLSIATSHLRLALRPSKWC